MGLRSDVIGKRTREGSVFCCAAAKCLEYLSMTDEHRQGSYTSPLGHDGGARRSWFGFGLGGAVDHGAQGAVKF